ASRRRRREMHMIATMAQKAQTESRSDSWEVLYDELGRLGDAERAAIVQCDLEGLTHEEAARHLGQSVRTPQRRLERGRARLRMRLIRRGAAPSGLSLSGPIAPALKPVLSSPWVEGTVRTAVEFAAGHVITAGTVPAMSATLAEGVLHMMFLSKIQTATVTV